MGILTRYLIRQHAAPFFFALAALTGLLYLNSVAQKLDDLVGKSLPWDLVAEFLILTLPHTLALSIPMSVLVAVLYAFAQLGENSELMAMSAGGIKPTRMTAPVMIFGAIFTVVMLVFNDRILPEANHRLKNLTLSISDKRPTFLLEEGIINEIRDEAGDSYFLYASRIDPVTSKMEDVQIRTLTTDGYRTIYADRGEMAFNSSRTDLFLTLQEGEVREADPRQPAAYELTAFSEQVLPLRGINNQLESRSTETRTDREMSLAMLSARADTFRMRRDSVEDAAAEALRNSLLLALGHPPEGSAAETTEGEEATWLEGPSIDEQLPTQLALSRSHEVQMNAHLVEYHKKIAIAVACLAFVLIGAPLSMRFPRGGVGMVILVSVTVFGIYWMGLIGGEELADRGIVAPWVAMWAANAIFFALGLILFLRMGNEGITARGGGWDDWLRARFDRIRERMRRDVSPAGGTAG